MPVQLDADARAEARPGLIDDGLRDDDARLHLRAADVHVATPATSRSCRGTASALGDIYHAAPAVVGPPGTLLQDPAYLGFREHVGQTATRSSYAATNDGLLHAFWADETKLENNELWAMLLPAVMPNLYSTYPSSHGCSSTGRPS